MRWGGEGRSIHLYEALWIDGVMCYVCKEGYWRRESNWSCDLNLATNAIRKRWPECTTVLCIVGYVLATNVVAFEYRINSGLVPKDVYGDCFARLFEMCKLHFFTQANGWVMF